MPRQIKNRASSIHNKLLGLAEKTKIPFNGLLLQYCQKRLLYRLSVSPYQKNFVLKGGLLLLAYKAERLRPTKDIDFLGLKLMNDFNEVKKAFSELTAIELDDGLRFNVANMTMSKIQKGHDYEGIRLSLPVSLGSGRLNLKLDIGFGDKVIPGPVKKKFPVLLDNPAPVLYVYTIESSLSEKLEAMVSRGIDNSRMKDFYDVLFMAESHIFKKDVLLKAIIAAFGKRGTAIEDRKNVFSGMFMNDSQKAVQWKAFLSRNGLAGNADFQKIVGRIAEFVEPVFQSKNHRNNWNPKAWKWVV